MQPVESECDACGDLVRTTADGDTCGPCEVALCRACLRGTARCPSCQRRFADTRSRAPAAVSPPANYTRVMGIVALLGLVGAFVYVQAQTEPAEAPGDAGAERAAFRGVGGTVDPLAMTCSTVRARYRASFEQHGGFQPVPTEAEADLFAATLEPVLIRLGARVRPLGDIDGYPTTRAIGALPEIGYGMHFNVTDWAEPRVGDNASGGRVIGNLFVERLSPRQMLCVAQVDHSGPLPDPGLPAARAIGAARVALILGALEAGAADLAPAE